MHLALIEGRPTVSLEVSIRLTEAEAGALDALTAYGIEPFLTTFYEKMGRSVLQPYEAGLRSLFKSLRDGDANVSSLLKKAKDARGVFSDLKKVVSKSGAGGRGNEQ
jgi:hypothetical protein